jgi:hypothetical protein
MPRLSPLYGDDINIATQIIKRLVNKIAAGNPFCIDVPGQNVAVVEENWSALYNLDKQHHTVRMYKDQYAIIPDYSRAFSQVHFSGA